MMIVFIFQIFEMNLENVIEIHDILYGNHINNEFTPPTTFEEIYFHLSYYESNFGI